jgi:hypothetical protein
LHAANRICTGLAASQNRDGFAWASSADRPRDCDHPLIRGEKKLFFFVRAGDVRPWWQGKGMTETNVSASHFRVHLKEIANAVKAGKQAVTVERHGCRMFVAVSLEDFEFLRKHKYGKPEKPAPEEQPEMITLIHPDQMPIEMVEEAYELSNGTTDDDLIAWRHKAYFTIRATRGKRPAHPPW